MKEEMPEPKNRLLREVLQEEASVDWEESGKRRALASFRRGRLIRRLAMTSPIASIVLLVVATMLFRPKHSTPLAMHENIGETASIEKNNSPVLPTLTDEELLASFPPNTCFIGEVDGRKVLVFANSDLQKKYTR